MTGSIPGFHRQVVNVGTIDLSVQRAGSGRPLILLHGYPQNGMCWTKVAPEFAEHFQVIIPDLRGYGQSGAPPDDAGHRAYSKRVMAQDIVGLMDALGCPSARVLAHDRGARVGYRMALDHPGRIDRIGIIEIVPTVEFWDAWTAELALSAYHWTFLAQPAPLPESLIAADPVGYIDMMLARWTRDKSLSAFTKGALESYREQARDPARIAAMCADYRAGATVDRALDATDRDAGRKITAPLKFLWAEDGFPARTGDPLGVWKRWATQVWGQSCVSGHFAMEENPQAVLETFLPFFLSDNG